MSNQVDPNKLPQLYGHPTGLYTLFFAEMWERFSYYGMRALLIFYMIKGFLGFGDKEANAVYGAYTALVYMTPFFGGMIADRLLGARISVVIGGILMAAGHLLMTLQSELWFFSALGLLILGNGFFKPNISTMVGSLYPQGSHKRDAGFTIFYIGINLGAAMSPLLCGYVGETYGWHYGFGIATIGMLAGLAVFVAPNRLSQVVIGLTTLVAAVGLFKFNSGDSVTVWVNTFVAFALLVSGYCSISALAKGGLPKEVGGSPFPEKLGANLTKVLIGTAILIPVFVILVSGFSVIPGIDSGMTLIPDSWLHPMEQSSVKLVRGFATFFEEASRPAGLVLILAGLGACIYLLKEALSLEKIARERMYVFFILTFFALLFWAFFEQQGSSINNFTDRNVDRVLETETVTAEQVGETMQLRLIASPESESLKSKTYLSQEFLGHENGSALMKDKIAHAIRQTNTLREEGKRLSPEEVEVLIAEVNEYDQLTMSSMTYLREFAKSDLAGPSDKIIDWTFTESNVGQIGLKGSELPASIFQAVNPIIIMIFGIILSWLWAAMGKYEPSTPVKFALGIIQLGMGFGALYVGAQFADGNGMVAATWLFLMYFLLTTGELFLSPVGLSMTTKLSPARLVSTSMGAWFLATAFSQFLAAIIAQYAAVDMGSSNIVPPPTETVHLYGDVYGFVAVLALGSGLICLLLSPTLKRWMHEGEKATD